MTIAVATCCLSDCDSVRLSGDQAGSLTSAHDRHFPLLRLLLKDNPKVCSLVKQLHLPWQILHHCASLCKHQESAEATHKQAQRGTPTTFAAFLTRGIDAYGLDDLMSVSVPDRWIRRT